MKKTLLLMVMAIVFAGQLSAQYCGNSGSGVCTPSGALTTAGLTPSQDIPCIVRGAQTDIVIQFKNYDTLTAFGQLLTIESLAFDSINNLPSGLCWASNKVNNLFVTQEDGCLRISGITNAPVGQYKLDINLMVDVGFGPIPYNSEELTLGSVYLRVVNTAGSLCPLVDTMQNTPYEPGVNTDNIALIRGKVFIDANQNNTYDTGETGLRNIMLSIGNTYAITNAGGDYHAYIDSGSYTITPLVPVGGGVSFTIPNLTVAVNTLGVEYAGNNFAATVTPDYCEASLSVVNYNMPPRPGFINDVRVGLENTFSEGPLTQTIRLYYTAPQRFVGATPIPDNVDTVARFIEWGVSNIAMNNSWAANVKFYSPTTTELGTEVKYTVSVDNASCPALNSKNAAEFVTVVGSYDPNDKAVSPVGYGAWGGVNPDLNPVFTYKVRFQNTGTFLAENVTIIDTISTRLDISTLRVLSASHNYEVTIEDNRAVKFWFKQIMLADSNSNEPESHGYIQYAIKPYTGLAQDVAITNRADIYFDYNLPVLTNTTLTTIDYIDHTVGIREVNAGYGFTLFPNPTTGNVQLSAAAELVGEELNVTDISGRILLQQTITETTTTLNLSQFAKGIYLIKAGDRTEKLLLK